MTTIDKDDEDIEDYICTCELGECNAICPVCKYRPCQNNDDIFEYEEEDY